MRGHSVRSTTDSKHNKVLELLGDLAKLIGPLVPPDYKWVLWIDPGSRDIKYWEGTMTDTEFQDMLFERLETLLGRGDPAIAGWFKKGPPK